MSKAKQFSKNYIPLTPAIFYILLSLATKEKHGYDIMKQVNLDSGGKVNLGPGTLYGAIKRMLDEKLILEIPSPKGADVRRRYYKLTEKGLGFMNIEIKRLNEIVELARKRNLLKAPAVVKLALVYV